MKKERENLWRRRRRILFSVIMVGGIMYNSSTWAQGPVVAATTPISTSGQSIDPTKNVLDTLQAAVTRLNDVIAAYIKRQDDLREGESRFQNAMRESDIKRLNDLREAETRRVDQLAAQKQASDLELARVNRASVDSSALLLATAVKELKTDSSDRTSKLEQFANEQRGRASQADPANMKLLEQVGELTRAMAVLAGKTNVTDPITIKLIERVELLTQQKDMNSGGGNMLVYLLGAFGTLITLLIAATGIIVAVIMKRPQHQIYPPYSYPPTNGYPPNGNGYSSQPPTKNI